MEKKIYYFDKWGPSCTEKTLELAKERFDELGLDTVLIATSEGVTTVKALNYFKPSQIVCVTSMYGFLRPGEPRLTEENRKILTDAGVRIVHNTHVLAGIDRSVNRLWGGITPVQLMSQCYKLIGEGVKVCVEIAVMAADAGGTPVDRDVMTIGGTGRGADTAIVMKPAHSNNFFDMRFREFVCMPSDRAPKMQPL
ncbi:MAG: pyruvate kinase alpha/beta domain-containing protein [Bacillota bacterium]|nr:pyruvate kinase alpha/beta domain-containing protein [Bacillota bacterium]